MHPFSLRQLLAKGRQATFQRHRFCSPPLNTWRSFASLIGNLFPFVSRLFNLSSLRVLKMHVPSMEL